ncbi:MAG: hypothetical protein WAU52_09285, partial [Burkholderiales bacterium]
MVAASAGAAEEPAFDSAAFEKKPFELGGYVQFEQQEFSLNRAGALYKLGYYGESQRDDLGQTTEILDLAGKIRRGIGTFDFHTYSNLQQNQLVQNRSNRFYEAAYSLRPDPGLTLEVGKRALSWGKGYAFNPMGFVQRPKDPNDPLLAREGYVMADGDLIWNPGGALQTVAFTPVLMPVASQANNDFGASGHLNPAAKLYLLYRDTDLDFAWQGKGSRAARFGMDFARNLATNLEIHGEWARIEQFSRLVTDAAGHTSTEVGSATSYLLGLRYLNQNNTTFIAEYYHNGTGYSETEAGQFYQLVDTAFTQLQQIGSSPLLQKALALGQGPYGRPFAGEDYLYVRTQQQDAFGVVYFQPSVFAMLNLNDHSFQVTPELLYAGFKNLELRLRLYLLHGGSLTDFGEKPNSHTLEL